MRFDLTDLRLVVAVVETGSITHGAQRCHMALASASARIRGMEETLGIALLDRGRRGVRPTPAGQALVHHAKLMLHQLERMRGELGDYAKGLKGHVRLLANTAAVTEFLPAALADFLAAHPSVDIDLEERPSHEIVEAVASGFADLGVVADYVDFAGLETLPFRVDRLVLAVPRAHPLAARRSAAFRGARSRLRRTRPRQCAARPREPARGTNRTVPVVPGAGAHTGRRLPHGRAGGRGEHPPGNRCPACPALPGDQHRAPERSLGRAAVDGVRAPLLGPAAARPPTGGCLAQRLHDPRLRNAQTAAPTTRRAASVNASGRSMGAQWPQSKRMVRIGSTHAMSRSPMVSKIGSLAADRAST